MGISGPSTVARQFQIVVREDGQILSVPLITPFVVILLLVSMFYLR